MRRRTSWILIASLAVLAAIAAVAAVPPTLTAAIESQQRLTVERPNDAAVFNDLGNLLLLVPQPEEAEAAYRKAIELDPDKASARYNLGLLLQQRGELREAMKHYQQAVKVEPQHAWAHYQMGTLYERGGQPSRAIDSYGRAFALDPQLAFPEVNPHIVENKLVTEAMLRAYKGDYAPPQAPKVYEDPARIAALLVPHPQGASKDPVVVSPRPQDATANRQPQPGAVDQGQVLREGDLDRGNPAGQAVPQGMSHGRSMGSPTTSRGLREWNRPDPSISEKEIPEGVPNEEVEPDAVVAPPPGGGVYYRPGVQSTGRLSLQLVPQRPRAGRG